MSFGCKILAAVTGVPLMLKGMGSSSAHQDGFVIPSSFFVINSGPQVLRDLQRRLCYRPQIFLELETRTFIVNYSNGDVLFLSPPTKSIFCQILKNTNARGDEPLGNITSALSFAEGVLEVLGGLGSERMLSVAVEVLKLWGVIPPHDSTMGGLWM